MSPYRVVLFMLVVALFTLAIAQGVDAPKPTNWPELLLLLFSAPFGLASLWKLVVVADWKELLKSGSVYTAVSAIFAALSAFAGGYITLPEALGAVYLAIWAIFNRQALLQGGATRISR